MQAARIRSYHQHAHAKFTLGDALKYDAYTLSTSGTKLDAVQRECAYQMEATKDVTDYIVEFYNCQRRHSALGNLAPIDYEN